MAAAPLFVARAVAGGFAPEPGAASDVLALAGGEAVAVVAGPTPDGWCSGYRLAAPGVLQEELMRASAGKTLVRREEFNPQDGANMAWASATLGVRQEPISATPSTRTRSCAA